MSPALAGTNFTTVMKTTFAWVAVILLLPFIVLLRVTESEAQTVKRLRSQGWTQKRIAARLNITVYRVRKLLATAPPR